MANSSASGVQQRHCTSPSDGPFVFRSRTRSVFPLHSLWIDHTNAKRFVWLALTGLLIALTLLTPTSRPALAATTTVGCTPVAWGDNSYGQSNVPEGLTDVISVATNGIRGHSLAVKSDGTVVGWGDNYHGEISVPTDLTDVTAIATGFWATLALKSDGSLAAWGYNRDGQTSIPAGLNDVTSIAVGALHNVALRSDGTVVAWGYNSYGQTNVPANLTDVVAIAAGQEHTVVLKSDGTVVAWGYNGYGQTNVPANLTDVVAIAAGAHHNLALKSDGTVVAWGWNGYGQTNVPANLTGVIAIAAGGAHSVALKSDGTVVVWGINTYGQLDVPAGLSGVTAIASGSNALNTIALTACGPSPLTILTNSALSDGTVGQSYTRILQASGGAPPYTWAIVDGSLPLGLTLDPTTGVVSGIPTAAANWSFQVLVVDAEGAVAIKDFTMVTTSDLPPASGLTIVTNSALPNGVVDQPYSVILQASGGVEPYTWSVVDGALPPGLTLNTATGEISGIPTTAGTFGFVIQVMDSSNQTASTPFTMAPPPASGSTGAPYSAPIVISDPSSSSGTCSNYAVVAGALPEGVTLDPTTGIISGNPTTDGTYYFVVQCATGSGQTATKAFTITIYANQPPTVDAGADQTIDEGANITLSAAGHDDEGGTLSYAWDLDDDGVFETPGQNVTFVAGDGPSNHVVSVQVTDPGGLSAIDSLTINVLNVAPTATFDNNGPVDEGSDFTLSLTDPLDPSDADTAAGFQYAFNCGDGSGYGAWGSSNSVTCATTDNGTRMANGRIRDKDGGVSEYEASVEVKNVAPAVGPISLTPDPPVLAVNTAINARADFSDPGIFDTHTALWDWGDGTTSPGVIQEVNGSGSGTGDHTYTTPGVYTVKLTVTDKDGDSGESIYQFVVVYDPSGGFVTGGGWVDSPAGACQVTAVCQDATGKATFGFVSKYKLGAKVPTGNTEFHFKAGNLNFHSSSYDWLVVAGSDAKYKGVGTINGGGDYGFMLTGFDADVNANDSYTLDGFRIVIWDKADGDRVVYDNLVSLDIVEDDYRTQPIGGGSIVVHKEDKSVSNASIGDQSGGEGAQMQVFLPFVTR